MSELSFDISSTFVAVHYDSDSSDWIFSFSDSVSILVFGFWRLLHNGKIILVSLDHEQQFGQEIPTDMVSLVNNRLSEKTLTRIKVVQDTGDLKALFTDNIELECLVISTGYESFQFSISDKRYIALGGGDIAIY